MIEGEFAICNLADDLLLLTLDMCDRESAKPRLPKRLHRSLADRIILTASAVQEAVILANETDLSTIPRGSRRISARGHAPGWPCSSIRRGFSMRGLYQRQAT